MRPRPPRRSVRQFSRLVCRARRLLGLGLAVAAMLAAGRPLAAAPRVASAMAGARPVAFETAPFEAEVRRARRACGRVAALGPFWAARALLPHVPAARAEAALATLRACPVADPFLAAALAELDAARALARGDAPAAQQALKGLNLIPSWRVSPTVRLAESAAFAKVAWPGALGCTPDAAGAHDPWPEVTARPDGFVDLDGIRWPKPDAYVWATTTLVSPTARQAVLRIGVPEAVQVYLDGRRLHERSALRFAALDQDQVALPLRAGPNALTLALAAPRGTAPFVFVARLTDPAGRALADVRATADPTAMGPADCVAATTAAAPAPAPALGPFEAWLDRARGALPDDAVARRDAWRVLRASGRPLPAGLTAQSLLLPAADARRNPEVLLDLAAAARRPNRALEFVLRVLAARPDERPAQLALATLHLEAEQPLAAAVTLEQRLAAGPRDLRALALQARLWLEGGLAIDALERLRALRQAAPGVPALERLHAEALVRVGQRRAARAAFAGLADAAALDEDALFWLYELTTDVGPAAERRALLERLLAARPHALAYHVERARLEAATAGPGAGLAALAASGRLFAENPEALAALANECQALGDTEAAMALWRRSLERDPQNRELAARVAALSPSEPEPHAGLRVDPRARAAEAARQDPLPREAGGPAFEVLDELQVVTLAPSGLATRYVQRVGRVRRGPLTAAERTFRIRYDAGRQRVEGLHAVTIDPSGGVHEVGEARERSLSQPWYGLYYDERALDVPFGPLTAGHVVSVEYTVRDTAPQGLDGEFGDLQFLQGEAPRARSRYVVRGPAERPLHVRVVTPDARLRPVETPSEQDGLRTIAVTLHAAPGLQDEPGRPGDAELLVHVQVSSLASWAALGARYDARLAAAQRGDASLRTLARAAGAADASLAGRVARLFALVTTQIRYVGLEFGIHSILPYPAGDVFERRFGDCKDMANLLVVLLREVGIAAHVALVRTRPYGRLSDGPASLAAFDHAVVYVPALDLWLDPTDRYGSIEALPAAVHGASALLVAGAESRLVTVPLGQASARRIRTRSEWTLAPTGAARFALSERRRGGAAATFRTELARTAERRQVLESWLATVIPGVRVVSFEPGTLDAAAEPLRLALRGELNALGAPEPAGRRLPPAPLFGRLTPRLASRPNREWPLQFAVGEDRQHVTVYRLPPGSRIAQLPAPFELAGPLARFSIDARGGQDEVTLRVRFTLEPGDIAVADYGRFREVLARADAALDEGIAVAWPTPEAAPPPPASGGRP